MEESWEQCLSDSEMDEWHLYSENHINSLMEEFKGETTLQLAQPWESHSSDSNLTTESTSIFNVALVDAAAATSNTVSNSSLEEIAGFDNSSLKQQASPEKPMFSSSVPYILSFEDSTAVPKIPEETCQNHGAKSKEKKEEPDNRMPKRARSSSQIQDHIMAERKRRENITRMFIALSATIAGLKKVDKASVLNDAIAYVKYLQKRVKELEEQNKRRKMESIVYVNNYKPNVVATSSCLSESLDRPIKTFPNVEARASAKDVLVRVMCGLQDIVPKLLAKLEANNLSIVGSSVLPFGSSASIITIIVQMDHEFSITMDDLVKNLNDVLLQCNNNDPGNVLAISRFKIY